MKDQKKGQNSNYLALYRKYRPTSFKELVGQDFALEPLKKSIALNKINHAYIFFGDRGTGKTTTARIFAKEIGSDNSDIFELDAASNNSVEDIRLIIEAAKSSTFGSKYKVYILDEAHMLSKAAFNALLKTLEEPPEHVIFILSTTDKEKIPSTIISRCQIINFSSPNILTLEKYLKSILDKEAIEMQKEAITEVAKEGKGSFRDSLGVLEKVIFYTNTNKISLENVLEALGKVEIESVFDILEAFCKEDNFGIIKSIQKFENKSSSSIEKVFFSFIKLFEASLYIRISGNKNNNSITDTFLIKDMGESLVKKLEELSSKYPNKISSANLLKILSFEKDIVTTGLKREYVTISLLSLLDR